MPHPMLQPPLLPHPPLPTSPRPPFCPSSQPSQPPLSPPKPAQPPSLSNPPSQPQPSPILVPEGDTSNRFSHLQHLSDQGGEVSDVGSGFELGNDPWNASSHADVPPPPPPPTKSIDSKDPWEVAIRNEKEKRRKGKHTAATSYTEETRNSLRVKLNQMVGATELKLDDLIWLSFRLRQKQISFH
ncbi:uncharacterized protein LOC144559678 isoform X2 [Carex rostrata]